MSQQRMTPVIILAAVFGSLIQVWVTLMQVRSLPAGGYYFHHETWNWTTLGWERWIAVTPWALLCMTLAALPFSMGRHMGWHRSGALMVSLAGAALLLLGKAGLALSPSTCFPGMLCDSGPSASMLVLRDIGVAGAILVCFGLIYWSMLLVRLGVSRFQCVLVFLLGALTLHAAIVISDTAAPLAGYIKVDPVVLVVGLAWACTWLMLSIVVWPKALQIDARGTIQ